MENENLLNLLNEVDQLTMQVEEEGKTGPLSDNEIKLLETLIRYRKMRGEYHVDISFKMLERIIQTLKEVDNH